MYAHARLLLLLIPYFFFLGLTVVIKKYYQRKKGLELSCSICGPTNTRDKIAVTTWILPVRSLQVIGWLFPGVKVGLLHNKGKNKGK
jgi:hypothetical protein